MSLHVESVGVGPPLVLLHGWALHSGLWQPLLPRLAQAHRLHLVDLPGHGYSPSVEPYTLDRIVALLDAQFAAEAGPLRVLGWSLGGLVAMRWAARHAARIGQLVLMCTSPRFVRASDWPDAMEAQTLSRFGDELRVAFRATLLRFLSLQVKDSEQGRASLALLRARLFERGEPSGATLQRALALLADTDLRAEIPALAQPALVIAGGHTPFLSHPKRIVELLDEFLAA